MIDDWYDGWCPKCQTRRALFWNSTAVWCLKCKWTKYRYPETIQVSILVPLQEFIEGEKCEDSSVD